MLKLRHGRTLIHGLFTCIMFCFFCSFCSFNQSFSSFIKFHFVSTWYFSFPGFSSRFPNKVARLWIDVFCKVVTESKCTAKEIKSLQLSFLSYDSVHQMFHFGLCAYLCMWFKCMQESIWWLYWGRNKNFMLIIFFWV